MCYKLNPRRSLVPVFSIYQKQLRNVGKDFFFGYENQYDLILRTWIDKQGNWVLISTMIGQITFSTWIHSVHL